MGSNLNRSGAWLGDVLYYAWICSFFFPSSSGSVLSLWNILLVWHFCTASCNFSIFFFFSLPWIIEYIVLYHRSPWDCSFVRCTRTSWLLCRRTAFRDFSFHVMTRVKKQISRIITPEDSLTSILQRSKASQKIKKEEKIHPALISRTCCCLSSQLNELDWSFVFFFFFLPHRNQRNVVIPSNFFSTVTQDWFQLETNQSVHLYFKYIFIFFRLTWLTSWSKNVLRFFFWKPRFSSLTTF